MNTGSAPRNHRPRKRLGQHFLRDPQVVRRILDSFNPKPGERVVEIGPGRGVLTERLLERIPVLHALELDRDLAAALAERFGARLRLVQGDVLRFDFAALADTLGGPLRLIGNLPYNISTPLLFHLLEQRDAVHDMLFMLQKEVVERLTARPGGKRYGRLTVMVGLALEAERLFDVPPEAFSPPPKVDSSMVRLRPRAAPLDVADRRLFGQIVNQAFCHRRKTLRNALRGIAEPGQIEQAGIDPGTRPETLSIRKYVVLTGVLGSSS